MRTLKTVGIAAGLAIVLVSAAHADPSQSGPDLRYGGSLIGFQPNLSVSKQVGEVEVRGWHTEAVDLEIEPAPIEYRHGSSDIRPQKMSGMRKHVNIYVKRPKSPARR